MFIKFTSPGNDPKDKVDSRVLTVWLTTALAILSNVLHITVGLGILYEKKRKGKQGG